MDYELHEFRTMRGTYVDSVPVIEPDDLQIIGFSLKLLDWSRESSVDGEWVESFAKLTLADYYRHIHSGRLICGAHEERNKELARTVG